MLKGILGDPRTTIVGVLALLVTLGLILGKLDTDQWAKALGIIAGTHWLLENKQ